MVKMSEYSKGELKCCKHNDNRWDIYTDEMWIGEIYTGYGAKNEKNTEANAKELVRRWNDYPALKQQRDDLRAACKILCKKYLQNLGTPNEFVSCITPKGIPDYWRQALAAISAAKS